MANYHQPVTSGRLATTVSRPSPMRFRTAKWDRYLFGYALILPALAVYALFAIYPMLLGVYVSLTDWSGFAPPRWVGLENYLFALKDNVLRDALWHNVVYSVVVTVVKTVLGLLLAVQLNQRIRGQTFFRTVAFLPVVMSFVVVGILWSWIFNPNFGLFNYLLRALHLEFLIQGWLSDPDIALWTVMGVDIWKWTGMHMVLLLAGLQAIPKELYESAMLDGASGWQMLWKITLPLLVPVLSVVVLLSLMGAWVRNYEVVYVMTQGGPGRATEVGLTLMVENAFSFAKLGYASAMGYLLALIVLAFSVVHMKVWGGKRYDV